MGTNVRRVAIVAGMSGGIGTTLAKELSRTGIEPYALGNANWNQVYKRIHGAVVVGIVNAAGKGMLSHSPATWGELYQANVTTVKRCVLMAKSLSVPLVHLGSAVEVNDARNDDYAVTKRMAGRLILEGRQDSASPLAAVHLLLHNVYGPATRGIVNDTFDQHARGRPALLRQPQSIRDFLYVEDVARSITRSLLVGDVLTPLPIGSGIGVTIARMAELVGELTGVKPAWRQVGSNPTNAARTEMVADTTCAEKLLDWQPTISLHRGLRLVADQGKI